ncbi:hypothetical protein EJ07DRAFT_154589 [Lizonia empirigonia]|nr:hypothetical protein EJ07DRAFT_154589 [Lizonia empirigonia]
MHNARDRRPNRLDTNDKAGEGCHQLESRVQVISCSIVPFASTLVHCLAAVFEGWRPLSHGVPAGWPAAITLGRSNVLATASPLICKIGPLTSAPSASETRSAEAAKPHRNPHKKQKADIMPPVGAGRLVFSDFASGQYMLVLSQGLLLYMTEHALKLQRFHASSKFAPQDRKQVSKRQISTRLHTYGNYIVHLMLIFNLDPNLILPIRTASPVASAESMSAIFDLVPGHELSGVYLLLVLILSP